MRHVGMVVAAVGLLAAGGAFAQDGDRFGDLIDALGDGAPATADRFGALADAFGEEPMGPWSADLADDGSTYTLTNTEDVNAYRLFMTPEGKSVGQRRVTAEVEIAEGDALSHAGILVAYREDPLLFYFWALEPGGYVTLWRLDAESAEFLTSARAAAIVEGGVNRLTVHENRDQLSLYVNDELVGLIGGLDGMGEGRFGVAVWGTGRYVFHSYEETIALPQRAGNARQPDR